MIITYSKISKMHRITVILTNDVTLTQHSLTNAVQDERNIKNTAEKRMVTINLFMV